MRELDQEVVRRRKRIEKRLREIGKTGRSASLEVGSNTDLFRNIFRGKSLHPRGDTVAKIARALGRSEQWVLTGEETVGDNPRELRQAIIRAVTAVLSAFSSKPIGPDFDEDELAVVSRMIAAIVLGEKAGDPDEIAEIVGIVQEMRALRPEKQKQAS